MTKSKLIELLSDIPDNANINIHFSSILYGSDDDDIEDVIVLCDKDANLKKVFITNNRSECIDNIINNELFDSFDEFIASVYSLSYSSIDYDEFKDMFDDDEEIDDDEDEDDEYDIM